MWDAKARVIATPRNVRARPGTGGAITIPPPMMKSSLFLLLSSLLSGAVRGAITTEYLAANGLTFTCTVLKHTSQKNPDAPLKEIMLLHGLPWGRQWWHPLLEHWDDLLMNEEEELSVHAVACDLRGYSPGASPDNIEDYDYSIFVEDTFALAQAAGFDEGRFHLMGHDNGAILAWYVAGNDPNDSILSLTTMSVPHIGLLTDAVCGDNVDEDQVIAGNYVNQFSLPDSASRNNASLTDVFRILFGLEIEPSQFQKMLWWYDKSPLMGPFSFPRVVSDAEVDNYEATYGEVMTFFIRFVRFAIPLPPTSQCIPVPKKIGAVKIPTLFVCGLGDPATLCNNSYVHDFPPELLPNYEHANYQCGHNFFLEDDCNSMQETMAVMEKITSFVMTTDDSADDESVEEGSSDQSDESSESSSATTSSSD